jgi:NADH:ubiquinone reductase (H+-translocating)
MMIPRKVVIVGGGFAGLNLAKKLTCNRRFHVLLVDRNNYHFFPPLLYQVSTAFIEPSNVSYPFRKMFQERKNLRFHMGSLERISPETNTIETTTGTVDYDYLVLALGTETNFFGMENVKENALPMKTIDDALTLRNHLLLNVEKLIKMEESEQKEKLRNIVIAGGGPTGVEIAGMLAEMSKNILMKDYPEIKTNKGKIYLIDSGDSLLGPMSEKSQQEAYGVLKSIGVEIKLGVAVKDYIDANVLLSTGELIPSNTLIWATGVIAREAPGLASDVFTRGRRIIVDEFNRVKNTKNIFAIGDIALSTADPEYPSGHPQLAQVAIQQGKQLGRNLERIVDQEKLQPFRYKNKGTMAIIAKYKAVVDLPHGFLKGFTAWIVWLFIHIIPIAGFRNKVKLAMNWFWSFITDDPTLRLIIRPGKVVETEKEKIY